MEGEMENTIERIKLLEQDKEAKLKEKRALEANLASLKRNLHDTMMATRKLKEVFVETTARADAMEAEVNKAQAFYSSLCAQDEASKRQLQQMKSESEEGIAKVWELRNKLCNEVHKVADQCDVWALFTMPKYIEPISKPKKIPRDNANLVNQKAELLNSVLKKRQSLIVERDRLLNEPECGEEFKRIKNALQYSVQMAAQKMGE